jgi:hypothetical protein
MKTILNTKIALLILLAGLAFSCKKNETTIEPAAADSTETMIDTVGPEVDTTSTDTVRTMPADSIKK